MKILYVAHRLPYPADKGDKIRSCHQLEYLAARHDVWCAAFFDDPADATHVPTLRRWCAGVHAVPLSRSVAAVRGALRLAVGGTITEGFYRNREMSDVLRRWSAAVEFDAALFFSSGVAPYRDAVRARRVVLDLCDCDSLKWQAYAERASGLRSWLYGTEAHRLRRRESHWLGAFDACTVVTRGEADALRRTGAIRGTGVPPVTTGARLPRHDSPDALSDRLHIIGNGADIGMEPLRTADRADPVIGFVGQMDYAPNIDAVRWFADCVFPVVRNRAPNATLEIVGRAPTRAVRTLAGRENIRVTGAVPDVRPRLERFAVSVAPLRIGRGIQNKVLEAMSAARPVVLTSISAAGIDAVAGRHFLIADDPQSYADAIVRLLNAPAERAAIGAAARAWVAQNASWPHELARLESLLTGGSQ
ncbi:MAG: TIGR03087 family PEP-CTERM/XrtA system glycosyltransferase [Phycisphaerales bacterium]|nr:TIGR03087 family PEP-CTERM/XrtA system glycosyltransferase [Phycisphaerales bacterium]